MEVNLWTWKNFMKRLTKDTELKKLFEAFANDESRHLRELKER